MSRDVIKKTLTKFEVVAIVGISGTVGAPSHRVGTYLKMHGYKIIPVNPNINKVLGCKSYRTLIDMPDRIQKIIEVVSIFRKPEDVPPIIQQVITLRKRHGKPHVVWMQAGVADEHAVKAAKLAGLLVISDKCIMAEHRQFKKELSV